MRGTTRRELNPILAVGLADAAILIYVVFIDRNDTAVSVIGLCHGLAFLALLWLTARGTRERR